MAPSTENAKASAAYAVVSVIEFSKKIFVYRSQKERVCRLL
jgi:hypothetical protein